MIIADNSAVIATLQAKLDRYEQALRFYANAKLYSLGHSRYQLQEIVYDEGKTARNALKGGVE